MTKPSIGFIGLGVMGKHMSGHLARAGYTLTVHDIDSQRAAAVAAEHPGMKVVGSPREVAEAADVVVTMLPSGEYVRDVALGSNGLIHGLRPGSILLDTSSCEPWITVETASALGARDVAMVDAPVSGAEMGAREATLVFMVGGDSASLQRVRPLLEVMGKKVFHLGPVGAGHAMKSINNLITSVALLATAEGLAIGKRFGLDPAVMTDVLNVSTGESWITRTHIKQRIISRKFDDPFKLGLMVKDIRIAMELARQLGLSIGLSARDQELWQAAERKAGPDASVSELVRWVEHETGVEIA